MRRWDSYYAGMVDAVERLYFLAKVEEGIRQIQAFLGDQEMTYKLVHDVAPRYAERNGGYTRIYKMGPRAGDNAQMARIELV